MYESDDCNIEELQKSCDGREMVDPVNLLLCDRA